MGLISLLDSWLEDCPRTAINSDYKNLSIHFANLSIWYTNEVNCIFAIS
jgi:hypothetical protein